MTIAGIAVFLLLAQNATPQQPAAPAAPASIEGVVVKAATGESLSKVTVTLTEARSPTALAPEIPFAVAPNSPEYALVVASLNQRNTGPPQAAMTASDGKFLIENVKPGTYSIKATLGGYAPAEYGQRGPNGRGMNITVKAGQKIQGISLTMTPGGTILGRVTDANGEPLSRALIQAQKLIYQERGRSLVTVQAVYTDDRGDYRLFWLPAGQYYINATPSDDRMRTMTAMLTSPDGTMTVAPLTSNMVLSAVRDMGTGPIYGIPTGLKVNGQSLSNGDVIEEAAVPVFYPSASEQSTATSVEVRPGSIISGIDITTKPARVYRIRGRIISSSGRPVFAADIVLVPRNSQVAAQSSRVPQEPNNSGFEIAGVLPGSYYLLVTGMEAPGMPVVGLTSVDVQLSSLENVTITASPPFAVQGRISRGSTISTAATPPQTYTVRVEPQLTGLPNAMVLGTNLSVRQDNFILPISVATDYRITVATPANTYVQSIRFGGQDVLRDGLHIDGATSETLEIVVSPNAGRLEGNVSLDRQKFANATVVLVPSSSLRQQTSLYQTTQTNAEGHFTFENIPPGSYKVFAWEDVEPLAWLDADFIRNFESRSTDVLIRESAKESVEMTLIPR
jgi:protocatechuate 3,4-dioxygenase beta subunit